jgi:hypothetical protein
MVSEKLAETHQSCRLEGVPHFSLALVPLVQFPAMRSKNLAAIEAFCSIIFDAKRAKWKSRFINLSERTFLRCTQARHCSLQRSRYWQGWW